MQYTVCVKRDATKIILITETAFDRQTDERRRGPRSRSIGRAPDSSYVSERSIKDCTRIPARPDNVKPCPHWHRSRIRQKSRKCGPSLRPSTLSTTVLQKSLGDVHRRRRTRLRRQRIRRRQRDYTVDAPTGRPR